MKRSVDADTSHRWTRAGSWKEECSWIAIEPFEPLSGSMRHKLDEERHWLQSETSPP
jgi:hypothetical protein